LAAAARRRIGGMNNNQHRISVPTLGIDIGRVIICPADSDGRADTSFLGSSDEQALETPPGDGAFEAIAELTQAFHGRVWLVSKCGPRIQDLTRRWLERQRFHETTGVPRGHVRFCRKRPEKRDHCAAIGATHFVDDRLDVLTHLVGLVPRLYWFGYQSPHVRAPDWATPTADWSEARRAILSRLSRRHAESEAEPPT
jgi:hypothetical protein